MKATTRILCILFAALLGLNVFFIVKIARDHRKDNTDDDIDWTYTSGTKEESQATGRDPLKDNTDGTYTPETKGESHDSGNGALQGMEHKGVDADSCPPGTPSGLAIGVLPFGRFFLRRNRNTSSVSALIL